ncbi:MAG: carbonic anhydrase family protein [Myxococcota bacterium]
MKTTKGVSRHILFATMSWTLAACGAVVLCGCAHRGKTVSEHSHQHSKVHAAKHWSYEGKTGPSHWGNLDAEFAQCRIGRQQSPIDITSATASSQLTQLGFHYVPTQLRIKNSGHTLVAQFHDDAGFIEVGEKRYKLLQFHFHTASEHRVRGETYAMEIHLVHQNMQGKLLVVGGRLPLSTNDGLQRQGGYGRGL